MWLGAEVMVRGSSSLALGFGVRPLVVGLTVVAFGTSAPELVVSITATLANSPDIAIGNVIGSNIANVGLIVGFTAIVMPIAIDRSFLKMDMPFLFGAMVLLYIVSFDNQISRLEGAIMFAGLIIFIATTYITSGKRGECEDKGDEKNLSTLKAIIFTVAGLIGLTAGARLSVWSGVAMATIAGIPELVIGATIIAFGTSLPELAASLVAVIKKQPELGLGNVIGSNIFNVCSILGIAPMIKPLRVAPRLLVAEFPIMIGFSIVLTLMLLKKRCLITRIEGVILFAGYIAFLVWSFFLS